MVMNHTHQEPGHEASQYHDVSHRDEITAALRRQP